MSASETTAAPSIDYRATDPDVRLMLRVRDGDAAAFEALVERYQARLLTVLQNLVGCRDRAEDLAQDVFLRVYRSRSNYSPEAKFSTWLYTIANNVASNARRSLGRRREINVAAGNSADSAVITLDKLAPAPSGQMPARLLDKAETAEVVRWAIDSLNERQRMALLLCKFEHMSYAEIAAAMQMSEKAVKSLLSRARENLRAVLEPYMSEGSRR